MRLTITRKKWFRAMIWASLGVSLCLISYKIHESCQEQVFGKQHSSVVRMPIIGRVKGLGALKSPNKILVWHKGKRYPLPTGNPYFRITAKEDSIEVHVDPARGIAVLKDANVSAPSFMLSIIFIMGLGLIGYAIYNFYWISALQKRGLK
jgi:hypothetical protein